MTTDYLTPVTPSPALERAQRTEKEATDAYYEALSASGGVTPTERLSRLNARIRAATAAKQPNLTALLQKQVPQLVNSARQFDLLDSARQRASDTLEQLSSTEADESRGGAGALGVSFVDESDPAASATDSVVASAAVRRGFAAGLAAALVLAGFTLAVAYGRGRSRRDDDEFDEPRRRPVRRRPATPRPCRAPAPAAGARGAAARAAGRPRTRRRACPPRSSRRSGSSAARSTRPRTERTPSLVRVTP